MIGNKRNSVLFLMVVLVTGCGNGNDGHVLADREVGEGAPFTGTEESLTGTWWQMPVTDKPIADDYDWDELEQSMKVPLELNEDGTYTLDVQGYLIEGTWSYEAGILSILGNGSPSESQTWHVAADGQSMERLDTAGTVTTCIR